MKKTILYSIIISICCIAFYACNDEWKDEQYEKYVSFTKSGLTKTYLNYKMKDEVVTYVVPVEVSGSTTNNRNVKVTVELDPDTLAAMNKELYFNREDLYYRLLDPKYYSFQNMETTIESGKDVAYIHIDFLKIKELDLVEKYILPLNIVETSEYAPSPKKWYRRSLMHIIPFNNYSGTYSATGGKITEPADNTPTTMNTREMRVVDENTVFFYAGLTEEDARNRALYKVRAEFVPDTEDTGKIILSADSAAIGFTYEPTSCYYTIENRMDDVQPYLLIKTITMYLKYTYNDITNPNYSVTYKFDGSYVLERRRNTKIPDEDQQDIFD